MGWGGRTVAGMLAMLDDHNRIVLGKGHMGWRVQVVYMGMIGLLGGTWNTHG